MEKRILEKIEEYMKADVTVLSPVHECVPAEKDELTKVIRTKKDAERLLAELDMLTRRRK